MGMTAHWIDEDWVLHDLPLGIYAHQGDSKSEDLVNEFLEKVLKLNDLHGLNLFSVTSDTTSAMGKFGRLLNKMGVSNCYCSAHTIQLSCAKLYNTKAKKDQVKTTLGEASTPVEKVRKMVNFFHHSVKATEKLIDQQTATRKGSRPLKLKLDVITRWWSTFDCIERVLELKEILVLLSPPVDTTVKESHVLTPSEWGMLESLAHALKPFKTVMKLLEGSKYVTSSLVVHCIFYLRAELERLASAMEEDEDEEPNPATKMAKELLRDFEGRWRKSSATPQFKDKVDYENSRQIGIHPIFWYAAFLDPRMKRMVNVPPADVFRVRDAILGIMMTYVKKQQAEFEQPPHTSVADTNQRVEGKEQEDEDYTLDSPGLEKEDDTPLSPMSKVFGQLKKQNRRKDALFRDGDEDKTISDLERDCTRELDLYVQAESLHSVNENPLEWWKKHEKKYPVLSTLAKTYLAVPATSAPTERVFSAASGILSKRRASLSSEMAGVQLFVALSIDWYEEQLKMLGQQLGFV